MEAARLPQPAPRRRGAADPAPQRLQDRRAHGPRAHLRRGRRGLPAQPGLGPGRRRGRRPASRCSRRSVRRSRPRHEQIRDAPGRGPRRRAQRAGPAPLAGHRAAHPQGLDRPRTSSTASRSRAPTCATRSRCRASSRRTRSTCGCSRSGCAATGPTSCSTTSGRLVPGAARRWRRRATSGCRPRRTPTAAGCARELPHARPRRPTRCDVRAPGGRRSREHPPVGRAACATCMPRRPPPTAAARSGCSARTRPRATGCRRSSRSPTAASWRRCGRPTTTSARTAGSWRCSSEHLCQGWLEGYLAQRAARGVRDLRGVRDGVGLDGRPARQVAPARAGAAVARDRCRRSTCCSPRPAGATTTTGSPTRGPG